MIGAPHGWVVPGARCALGQMIKITMVDAPYTKICRRHGAGGHMLPHVAETADGSSMSSIAMLLSRAAGRACPSSLGTDRRRRTDVTRYYAVAGHQVPGRGPGGRRSAYAVP